MRAIFRSTTKVCTPLGRRLRDFTALALIGAFFTLPVFADTNRIIIRVNDRIATLYDYEKARRLLIEDLRRSDLSPELLQEQLADVGVKVMSDLLEEMLLLSRGDQIDAKPVREEIVNAMQQAKENAGIENDEDFVQGLAVSGFTLESFQKHLEKNLTMNNVMGAEVRPRIRLEEEDLRRYYQGHLEDFRVALRLNVREIVVLDTATTTAEGRAAIAQDIRERLVAGEDADALISEYAEKELTTAWIDLGWTTQGDLDPAIEAAIQELDVGDFSTPVPARGGLHLVEVLEREEATIQEFAAVSEEIRRRESNRRFSTEIGEYLAELERNSFVVINPPPDAAAFRTVLQRRREDGLEFTERERALSVPAAPPVEDASDDGSS